MCILCNYQWNIHILYLPCYCCLSLKVRVDLRHHIVGCVGLGSALVLTGVLYEYTVSAGYQSTVPIYSTIVTNLLYLLYLHGFDAYDQEYGFDRYGGW